MFMPLTSEFEYDTSIPVGTTTAYHASAVMKSKRWRAKGSFEKRQRTFGGSV